MDAYLRRLDAALRDDELVPMAGRAAALEALLAELDDQLGGDAREADATDATDATDANDASADRPRDDRWLRAFGAACRATLRLGHHARAADEATWQARLAAGGGDAGLARRLVGAGLLVADDDGLVEARAPALAAFAAGRAMITAGDADDDLGRRLWAGLDRAFAFAMALAHLPSPHDDGDGDDDRDAGLADRLAAALEAVADEREGDLGLTGALVDRALVEGARLDEARVAARFRAAMQALVDPLAGPRALRRLARLLAALLRAGGEVGEVVADTALELLGEALAQAATWDLPALALLAACGAVADEVPGLDARVRARLAGHPPDLAAFFAARRADRAWPWPLPADEPWPFAEARRPMSARAARLDALGAELGRTDLAEVGPLAAACGAWGRGLPAVGEALLGLLAAAVDAPGGTAALPGLLAGLGAVGLGDDEAWARANLGALVGALGQARAALDAAPGVAADVDAVEVAAAALVALGRVVDDRRWHPRLAELALPAVEACLGGPPRLRFAALEALTLWWRAPGDGAP